MNPFRSGPIFGFYHVALVDCSADIVRAQMQLLNESGLLAAIEKLFITVLGDQEVPTALKHEKLTIAYRSARLDECEFPTLSLLYDHCKTNYCNVFYVHTKGAVSGVNNPNVIAWREYMDYFIISRHSECLTALGDHDVCGVNWRDAPWPHYSGNYWWARSEYIQNLPDPRTLDHFNRHTCEAWIGYGKGVRAACLCDQPIGYQDSVPLSAYRNS